MMTCSLIVLLLAAGSGLGAAPPGPFRAPASQPSTAPGSAPGQPIEMLPPAMPVAHPTTRADGYRGQWFAIGKSPLQMRMRVSGPVAFYPPAQGPVAIDAAAAGKTFFVYAGAEEFQSEAPWADPPRLMVACFDHRTGTVARPVVLASNQPAETCGTPSLAIDSSGRLWVFTSLADTKQPCSVYRSVKPYDIDAWEKVTDLDIASPQVWHIAGRGFLVVHSIAADEHPRVYFSTSPDGLAWSKPRLLADFGAGHRFISGRHGNKVGVALTHMPSDKPGQPVNLYYVETSDSGQSWQVFPRGNIEVPLKTSNNQALVCDFGTEWKYLLRDLAFDMRGNPIVLYIMRHVKNLSPADNTRIWYTSRWAIREWETTSTVRTDNDFDGGCLQVDRMKWYMTIPTIPDPQRGRAGGSLVRWRSEDAGRSWYPQRLTHDEQINANWPRRVIDAAAEMTVLWSDGDMQKPSASKLYFADRDGNTYVLPWKMGAENEKPAIAWKAPPPPTQPATDSAPVGRRPR